MGIKGLTKLLNDEAPGCIREAELASYTGRRVAIDASMALYQFLIAIRSGSEGFAAQVLTNEAGEVTSHIQGIFNRTIRMLTNGIKPVFVFDGKPPTLKGGELAKRQARRAEAESKLAEADSVADKEKYEKRLTRVTRQHGEDTKELLRLMGVPVVQAPCEAEAQCAELARHDKVWATGTEDMDALCFRTPKLLRKLTFGAANKQPVMEVDYEKAIKGLGLTYEQFVDLCILCGCDYTDTIKGIGPKTALKLIRQHGSLESVVRHLDPGKYKLPRGWTEASLQEPEAAEPEAPEVEGAAPDESAETPVPDGETEADGAGSEPKRAAEAADAAPPADTAAIESAEPVTPAEPASPTADGVTDAEGTVTPASAASPADADAENQKSAVNRADNAGEGASQEDGMATDCAAATKASPAAGGAPAEAAEAAPAAPFEPLFAQARRFFVNPEVTPASEVELEWTPCDEVGLRAFLVDRMGFNADRVESGIRRLKDSRKMSSQARMDSFFKITGSVTSQTAASKRKASEAKSGRGKKAKKGSGGGKRRR